MLHGWFDSKYNESNKYFREYFCLCFSFIVSRIVYICSIDQYYFVMLEQGRVK